MSKMSFPVLWRKWIKECVTTATALVLFNSSPTYEFPLKGGCAKAILSRRFFSFWRLRG